MGGGTGNKGYKGDDAENMCGATLEPDPRYQECCSNVCRPGKVIRDLIIGLLVVLAIAVVIAVLFVLCYYLITPETEETVVGGESAFVGKPIENEKNPNVLNEVEFTDNTRYDVRPDVVLEGIRKENDEMANDHARTDHEEHHHMGPTPTIESEPEPEPESEPEPSAEPEPEPGKDHHDHANKEGDMGHDHLHKGDMGHDHLHKEGEDMGHANLHKEGDMGHDHLHKEGDMGHDHLHKEGDMGHDHLHKEGDMGHDHLNKGGDMGHDHVHLDGNMNHEHKHPGDGMEHMHPHSETGRQHPDDMIHMHKDEDMKHEMMHKEVGITHEAGITHEEGNVHDHIHTDGQVHHEPVIKDGMGEENMGSEHAMDHEATGPLFFPTAPVNDEVFEVVRSPALETVPSVKPTEHTVVSVSSASGLGAKVQIQSSESESVITPATALDNFGEIRESSSVPPLFDTLGFRPNATAVVPSSELFSEIRTEISPENMREESPVATTGPIAPVEEVDGPIFAAGEPVVTEVVPAGSCRPRQLEMCSDLPYGLTSLPNWANDQNEQELNESSLPFFRDVIVRSGCSPRARQYACGILEPPCKSDGSIIPPCRTFCRSVAATCQEFVISGFSLSNVFECDRFPDSSDPSVCFDMTQADGDEVPVEVSSSLPHIPVDQDYPLSARELSPEESPAPDYAEYTLVEDVPFDPTLVDRDYSTGTEDYVIASQDYPTDYTDLATKNATDSVSSLAEDEIGFQPNEELLQPEGFVETETHSVPEETFLVTESSHPLEAEESVGIERNAEPSDVPVVICDHDKFLCQDGTHCVPLNTVCDGSQHCADGSDEFNCTHIGCTNGDFRCATTDLCIPSSWLCDGADDCHDNSDEANCDGSLQSPEQVPASSSPTGVLLEGLATLGQFPHPGGHLQNVYQAISSEQDNTDFNVYGDEYQNDQPEYVEGNTDYQPLDEEEGVYSNSESINTFAYVNPDGQPYGEGAEPGDLPPPLEHGEQYQIYSEENRSPKQYQEEETYEVSIPTDEDSPKENYQSFSEVHSGDDATLSQEEQYTRPDSQEFPEFNSKDNAYSFQHQDGNSEGNQFNYDQEPISDPSQSHSDEDSHVHREQSSTDDNSYDANLQFDNEYPEIQSPHISNEEQNFKQDGTQSIPEQPLEGTNGHSFEQEKIQYESHSPSESNYPEYSNDYIQEDSEQVSHVSEYQPNSYEGNSDINTPNSWETDAREIQTYTTSATSTDSNISVDDVHELSTINYNEEDNVSTSTFATEVETSTVSEKPWGRGSTRFSNTRRPFLHRSHYTRASTEQSSTVTEASSFESEIPTRAPPVNFRSRFQQWRTSRIPSSPQNDSARTNVNRFRNRLTPSSRIRGENSEAFQRPTWRPANIRTSRITSHLENFHHEDFLKESAVIQEAEPSDSSDLDSADPEVLIPQTYEDTPEAIRGSGLDDRIDSFDVLDIASETHDAESETDPRLLEYRRDTSEYDLANSRFPVYLPYSRNQYAQGNFHN